MAEFIDAMGWEPRLIQFLGLISLSSRHKRHLLLTVMVVEDFQIVVRLFMTRKFISFFKKKVVYLNGSERGVIYSFEKYLILIKQRHIEKYYYYFIKPLSETKEIQILNS